MADGSYPHALNPLVSVQFTATGAVLMDTATSECFELNHVGAEIWRALESKTPPSEIVQQLAAKYGVPGDEISADLNQLIRALYAQGMLR